MKPNLLKDIETLQGFAKTQAYLFNTKDIFALGYLCGKYDLDKLIDNEKAVVKACKKYDKTDDLKLLDTISETLEDLCVIEEQES